MSLLERIATPKSPDPRAGEAAGWVWRTYEFEALAHARPARGHQPLFACGRAALDDRFARPDIDRPRCTACLARVLGSDNPAGAGESVEAARG